ncbi:MAG TPA: KpsF/GutQ family sugar-phosphate isomerase [Alphaproteobacteria bacterium]|nr:KpsF/GutQ family sugar-phosphate isomerase [Alphaproteobacteria bacterium]HCV62256.1 KpsF/GutQ family sugar-phosphate isomerase [Alphaproteobacteria bacterium]
MGEIYQNAIRQFMDSLDDRFNRAVEMLVEASGHVIICGMGKSGLFGRKISSTFASTGTPSIFLHPAEAIHGDLGKVRRDDIMIMISSSGETEEVIRLLPALKRMGVRMIAMTGDAGSTLASHADAVLDIAVDREACPLNLAPTTSGLMTLVTGDALAIALMEKRGFQVEDFAATHPGGALGKRLLSTVAETMVKENLPFVSPDDTMRDVIVAMTQGRLGIALVGSADNLKGIITDGDLRRGLVNDIDISQASAADLMTPRGLTINPEARMADAEQRMQEARVQCLVVMNDDDHVVGVVQIF